MTTTMTDSGAHTHGQPEGIGYGPRHKYTVIDPGTERSRASAATGHYAAEM